MCSLIGIHKFYTYILDVGKYVAEFYKQKYSKNKSLVAATSAEDVDNSTAATSAEDVEDKKKKGNLSGLNYWPRYVWREKAIFNNRSARKLNYGTTLTKK